MPDKGNPQYIRGLMVDSARLTERHEFYFELLDDMARWGFNMLWLHLFDDQGCAIELETYPELSSLHALSKRELTELSAAAAERDILVVPEVETLGHSGWLTRHSRYAHLAHDQAGRFNAACPSHPDTLVIMTQILGEVIELFDPPYVHAGMDEVGLAGCDRCDQRAQGKPIWWVYAEHVRVMHAHISGLGRRMIIWGDYIESQPEILGAVNKDVVVAHWHYEQVRPELIRRTLEAGFDTLICPAVWKWGEVIHPGAARLDNIDQAVGAAADLTSDKLMGVAATWWTPYRGYREAAIPLVARAGQAMLTGRAESHEQFFRGYIVNRFGLADPADDAPAEALLTLYRCAISEEELDRLLAPEPIAPAEHNGWIARAGRIASAARTLTIARREAKRRVAELTGLIEAGRLAVGLIHQGIAPQRRRAPMLARLRDRFEAYWDRARYPDDPKKYVDDVETPLSDNDMLLGRLARAAAMLADQ